LGTEWIETQEDLSLVKSTVVEVVKKSGTSVLNADDSMTMKVLHRARGNIILFSLDAHHPALREQIDAGRTAVTVDKGNAIIRKRGLDIIVCALDQIPITFGGIVDFNVANALAAIGALVGLGLPVEQIRNGVMTFYPSANQNPGRMNLFDFQTYKVLLDYGHNPDSVRALAKLLPRLTQGRKIALCHGTGSRTDAQIVEYGRVLASVYDYVLVADFDPRHRSVGETPALVRKGLLEGGLAEEQIEIVLGLDKAVERLFAQARMGDLLVIQPDELEPIMGQIMERYRQFLAGTVG
jgi:cyanophycin synthetase